MSGEDYTPTPYQIQVLREVAKHGTMRAAAEELCVSWYTVDSHLDALREKTGLHYLPQLVAWAAKQGWWDDEEGGG